jgi:hypothetical protein
VVLSDESFTVIGDIQREDLVDLGMGGAGKVGTFDEVLYEGPDPDSWERGQVIGSAHALFVTTASGQAVLTITLRFGDEGSEDSLTASGLLPYDEGVGDGILAVVGGTGGHKNRGGQLRVEVQNPHKYRFEP